KALVDAAGKYDVDLAVLGSRGTRGTWGPRLGSTALGVARSSPCSVLIVRSSSRRTAARYEGAARRPLRRSPAVAPRGPLPGVADSHHPCPIAGERHWPQVAHPKQRYLTDHI